jgi:ATP synthase F1 gamma subunit
MSEIKAQIQSIHDTEALEYITATLRDISAMELRELQARFSKNTSFYDELRKLYRLVGRISEQVGSSTNLGSLRKKESLYVAYTTNRHFYGSLNYDVMRLFLKSCGSEDVGLIIGGTGNEIWKQEAKKKSKVRFMQFVSDKPSEEETKMLLDFVMTYRNTYIVYPRFVSIYEQSASIVDITFRRDEKENDEDIKLPQFVLEPDVEKVQDFFLSQVRHVIFERILLETDLSRVATRLVRMDHADTAANELLQHERIVLRKIVSTFANIRLLENLTGYSQWKHKKM